MAVNPAAQVYSGQFLGDAVRLGSGLQPLRALQSAYAQQQRDRLANAKLQQQQQAADARNLAPLAADGWLPHNDELSKAVQQGYDQVKAKFADPNATPFEKRQFNLQVQAGLKSMADRSNEYGKKYKEVTALASDPRYNKAALESGAYQTFFRPDADGKSTPVPLQEYDATALDAVTSNPAYFNRDKVLQSFIKAEAEKESVRLGKAAPPGGYGTTRQASSDIFDVNPDGSLAINADGSYKIRDINALNQRARNDPFMLAILADDAKKAQAAAGSGAMQGYDQLSPEQSANLANLQRVAPAERADLATLLAPYGKVKSNQTQTYRAKPVGRASGAAKSQQYVSAPVEGDYVAGGDVVVGQDGQVQQAVPGTVPLGQNGIPGPDYLSQTPRIQQGIVSRYSMPAPVYGKEGAQPKPYSTDVNGIAVKQALVQGEDGKFQWKTNIDKPFIGSFGDAISLPVNKATGRPITPGDGAAYDAALRDPGNEAASFVQVITPKNKNFTADYTKRLDQLKAERGRQQDGDILGKGKYNTDAELADQAREDATGGTTISYIPNSGPTARTLDQMSRGAYQAHRAGVTGHAQKVRSSQPAPSRPSFLKAKTATQPAPKPARSTGGMF